MEPKRQLSVVCFGVLHLSHTSAAFWGLSRVSQFSGGSGGSQGVHVCLPPTWQAIVSQEGH